MVLVVTIEKGDSGTDSGSDGRRTKKNGVGCDKKGDSGGGSGNMGGGASKAFFGRLPTVCYEQMHLNGLQQMCT